MVPGDALILPYRPHYPAGEVLDAKRLLRVAGGDPRWRDRKAGSW